MMKCRLLSIIILAFYITSVNGQEIFIPDAIFHAKLLAAGVDTDGDNLISQSEASAIDSLDVTPREYNTAYEPIDTISSLTGIEHFINLRYLNCSSNRIDSCDLSSNLSLEVLEIISNDLEYL